MIDLSNFHEFHFLRPWFLLALLALPLFAMIWRHARADGGGWRCIAAKVHA